MSSFHASGRADTVTIFGYGSLMDEVSAASTMPTACNFRRGTLKDYQRVFCLVSVGRIINGKANLETNELAALSVVPVIGQSVHGVLFQIPAGELDGYLEREHRYSTVEVSVADWVAGRSVRAVTAVSQTDFDYRVKCGSDEEYYLRVGQHYSGKLWSRTDILPMPEYLVGVLKAAHCLGGREYLDHLLEDTKCSDGVTSIRQHCLNLLLGLHGDPAVGEKSLLKRLLEGTKISDTVSLANFILDQLQDIRL
jgi:hypothetical protein